MYGVTRLILLLLCLLKVQLQQAAVNLNLMLGLIRMVKPRQSFRLDVSMQRYSAARKRKKLLQWNSREVLIPCSNCLSGQHKLVMRHRALSWWRCRFESGSSYISYTWWICVSLRLLIGLVGECSHRNCTQRKRVTLSFLTLLLRVATSVQANPGRLNSSRQPSTSGQKGCTRLAILVMRVFCCSVTVISGSDTLGALYAVGVATDYVCLVTSLPPVTEQALE